jgi:hypothetical protein
VLPPLAGFQVTINGRIWVTAEEIRPSGEEASERLNARLQEIVQQIAESEPVQAATERLESARARVARLPRAHAAINSECVLVSGRIDGLRCEIRSRLLAHFIDGIEADTSALSAELATAQREHNSVVGALAFLVEHERTRCEIAELHCQADWLDIVSTSLDRPGDERLAKTIAGLAPIVAEEGAVDFDPRSTLGGLLKAEAQKLSIQATGCGIAANELNEKYSDQCRQRAAGRFFTNSREYSPWH